MVIDTRFFLDEIQEMENWEKIVNSLSSDFDVGIYATGSNSRVMSSEISTHLQNYSQDEYILLLMKISWHLLSRCFFIFLRSKRKNLQMVRFQIFYT